MNDIGIWDGGADYRFGAMFLDESDDYDKIWVYMPNMEPDEPVVATRFGGYRKRSKNLYGLLYKLITHESLHWLMIRMEGFETSKQYDDLYHYEGDGGWLP
jgi:hypothetical protein